MSTGIETSAQNHSFDFHTTMEFAKAQPVYYYAAGCGVVLLSPLVGMARIAFSAFHLARVPATQIFDTMAEQQLTGVDLNAWKNYKNPEDIKTFWRGQIVQGILEIVLPIISALVFLLRDVVYVRPEQRVGYNSGAANPYKGAFYTNIGRFDELREAFAWHKAVETASNQIAKEQKRKKQEESTKTQTPVIVEQPPEQL